MPRDVIKTTGAHESYAPEKLHTSLVRAGVPESLAREVVTSVDTKEADVTSSENIHAHAYAYLVKHDRPLAARYDLKRALFRLGPSGFPFEQYVAQLFRGLGYTAETNRMIRGRCVVHEADIVLHNDTHVYFVECKYHNAPSLRTDVKVSLYIHARFEDVRATLEGEAAGKTVKGILITNTDFTPDARTYAQCAGGVLLVGWRSPAAFSLAEMIEQTRLYPITMLTSLQHGQYARAIKSGVVLCSDVLAHPDILSTIGVHRHDADEVLREAHGICIPQKMNRAGV